VRLSLSSLGQFNKYFQYSTKPAGAGAGPGVLAAAGAGFHSLSPSLKYNKSQKTALI